MYGERDILNLGANIRKPFWQVKDPEWFPFDDDNFMVSRSMCHGPYNQTFIGNYSTVYIYVYICVIISHNTIDRFYFPFIIARFMYQLIFEYNHICFRKIITKFFFQDLIAVLRRDRNYFLFFTETLQWLWVWRTITLSFLIFDWTVTKQLTTTIDQVSGGRLGTYCRETCYDTDKNI